MIRLVLAGLAFLLVFSATMPSSAAGAPRKSVTIGEFTEVLRTKDIERITDSLDTILSLFGHEQEIMLEFLMELWRGRKDKHPSLPWKVINSGQVRLGVADTLLQARKNQNIEFDPEDMVTFADSKLDSNFPVIIFGALTVLERADTDRAVAILHREARRTDNDIFPWAVRAITRMCNPSADMAIEALLNDPLSRTKREFILKTKHEFDERKKKFGLCQTL